MPVITITINVPNYLILWLLNAGKNFKHFFDSQRIVSRLFNVHQLMGLILINACLILINAGHHLDNLEDFDHEYRSILGQLIQEEAAVNDLAIMFPDDDSETDDNDDDDLPAQDDEDLGFYEEEPQLPLQGQGQGSDEESDSEDDFAFVNEDFERQVPLPLFWGRGQDRQVDDEDGDHPRLFRPWEDEDRP